MFRQHTADILINTIFYRLSFGIHLTEQFRQSLRFIILFCQQQRQGIIGRTKPSCRIDTRCQTETNRAGIHFVDLCLFNEGCQSAAVGIIHPQHTGLDNGAVNAL